jgi:hypothetical protein
VQANRPTARTSNGSLTARNLLPESAVLAVKGGQTLGHLLAKDHVLLQTLTTPLLLPLRPERHLVPTPARTRHRSLSLLGGSAGLLAFLVVGLVPALFLGGAVGARLASVVGGAQASGAGATSFVVLGLVVAAALGAAFFATLGAAAGAIVGVLINHRAPRQVAP